MKQNSLKRIVAGCLLFATVLTCTELPVFSHISGQSGETVVAEAAAHTHTDDCYAGTKHTHVGENTKKGGCYQGKYTSGESVYCGSSTNDYLQTDTYPGGSCDHCGASGSVTSTVWTHYAYCDTCGQNIMVDQEGYDHKCSNCGWNNSSGSSSLCSYSVSHYIQSDGTYALSCGKSEDTYYDANGTACSPLCSQVVTLLVPPSTSQIIVAGGAINNTAVATFLDGHTETVECTVTNYNPAMYNTPQAVTLSYGNYHTNAKTAGPKTATVSVTVQGTFPLVVQSEDANKGTVSSSGGEILCGAEVSIEAYPNSGYNFQGWYSGDTLVSSENPYTFNMPAQATTYTARFGAGTYVLYVYSQGKGQLTAGGGQHILSYGTGVTVSAEPYAGFYFTGWYDGTALVSADATYSFTMPAKNLTLQARYAPQVMVVTFDANGGSCDTASKYVAYGDAYGALPVPKRDGYIFMGWVYKDINKTVTSKTTVGWVAHHTLTADWAEKGPDSMQVVYDKLYSGLPKPVKPGYTFKGWFRSETSAGAKTGENGTGEQLHDGCTDLCGGAQEIVKITEETEVHAHWEPNRYTVYFNANGGVFGDGTNMAFKVVTYDKYYGDLPVATAEGYTFGGWYNSWYCFEDGEGYITKNDIVDVLEDGVTFFAKWIPGTSSSVVNVTFDANGGTFGDGTVQETIGHVYPGTYTSPSKGSPFRDGWTMTGWFSAASGGTFVGVPNGTLISSEHHTLYAGWNATNRVILLDAQGGDARQYLLSDYAAEFEPATYYLQNPDVAAAYGLNTTALLKHYVEFGRSEGRVAIDNTWAYKYAGYADKLDTVYYYKVNPDVAAAYGLNPAILVQHFATAGINENRTASTGLNAEHTIFYGQNAGVVYVPVKTGYKFMGYYTKPDGKGDLIFKSDGTSNITLNAVNGYYDSLHVLYAYWEPETYTNNLYQALEGFMNLEGKNYPWGDYYYLIQAQQFQVPYGTTYTLNESNYLSVPNGFEVNFYESGNLAVEQDGSGNWYGKYQEHGKTVTFTQPNWNVEFALRYKPIVYLITYNLNGGTNAAGNPDAYNVLYGVTLADPAREGYTFAGWYTDASFSGTGRVYGINEGCSAEFATIDEVYEELAKRTTGNITLYAKWHQASSDDEEDIPDDASYIVALDQQGATTNGTLSVTAKLGEDMPTPVTLPKKEYTVNFYDEDGTTLLYTREQKHGFGGYFTESYGDGDQYYTDKGASHQKWNIPSDSTLYAYWKAASVTLPVPEKTGYEFAGWYESTTSSSPVGENGVYVATKNTDLYAKWTPENYTVTFDPQGGTVSPESKEVTYNETYGDLPKAVRKGYLFKGWWTEKGYTDTTDAGTQVTKDTMVTITADQTLYAHWDAIELPFAVKAVYTCDDGSLEKDSLLDGCGCATGTFDLYVNGTKVKDNVAGYSGSLYYGDTYEIKDIRMNKGYVCTGGTGGLSGTMELKQKTVWLKTKPAEYKLTYDANGGTMPEDAPEYYVMSFHQKWNNTVAAPLKKGYTFIGWFNSTNWPLYLRTGDNTSTTAKFNYGSSHAYWMSDGRWNWTSDVSVTARWTANTYTVSLSQEEATTKGTASVAATYDKLMPSITPPARTYTVTYDANSGTSSKSSDTSTYTFAGYFTKEKGEGDRYYTSEPSSYQNWNMDSGATLYADWSGGGITLPSATRTDYLFAGWSTDAEGTNLVGTAGDTYYPKADMELYAVWQQDNSLVHLDDRGATSTNHTKEVQMILQKMGPSIIVPEKTGYTFMGYYTGLRGTGTNYYDSEGKCIKIWTEETVSVLYAYWKQNEVLLPKKEEHVAPTPPVERTETGSIGASAAKGLLYADDYNTLTDALTDVQPYLAYDVGSVQGAIPGTEQVAFRARMSAWLLGYEFQLRSGMDMVRIYVTIPYRTQHELENEELVISELKSATYSFEIPKSFSYWEVVKSGMYYPEKVTVTNEAIKDKTVEISVENGEKYVEPPKYETISYGEKAQHVVWENYDTDGVPMLSVALLEEQYIISTEPGEAPDVDQYLSVICENAAWKDTQQAKVRSDRYVLGGEVILSDEWQQNGCGADFNPEGFPQEEVELTSYTQVYRSGIELNELVLNATYSTEAMITYIGDKENVGANPILQVQLEDINALCIHTPVVCNGVVCSGIENNQLILQEKYNYFTLGISNVGLHRMNLGYGNKNFAYALSGKSNLAKEEGKLLNQIRFPFDVYVDTDNDCNLTNDSFLSKETWYTIGDKEQQFYIPDTQKSGEYTIEFRSVAVNCPENQTEVTQKNANTDITKYVATDIMKIEMKGELNNFVITDTNDPDARALLVAGNQALTLKKGYEFAYQLFGFGILHEENGEKTVIYKAFLENKDGAERQEVKLQPALDLSELAWQQSSFSGTGCLPANVTCMAEDGTMLRGDYLVIQLEFKIKDKHGIWYTFDNWESTELAKDASEAGWNYQPGDVIRYDLSQSVADDYEIGGIE